MEKKSIILPISLILTIFTLIVAFCFLATSQGSTDLEAALSQDELSMDTMVIESTVEDEELAKKEANGTKEWTDELVLTEHDKQTIEEQKDITVNIAGTESTGANRLIMNKSQSRIANTSMNDEDKYIVVIGDSFSSPGPNFYWTEILADSTGYKLINEAENSTGFTVGPTPFVEQLQHAVANENFNKVEHIIVYGGVNDFQSGSSIQQTVTAIEEFWDVYSKLEYKPELHIAFGNVGYAQCQRFNGFYEWYTAIEQVLDIEGITGVTSNVPYWHFNEPGCFFDDLIHPNAKGQKMIAVYMDQLLNGSYTGVQRTNWYDNLTYNGRKYPARKTVHFDNGVVTVTVRMQNSIRLMNLQSNTFIDLGEVTNYSDQYSLMFGTDNANNPVIWVFDAPVYEAYKDEKFGILRPMFNVANKHLYLQMFGYAGAYKDKTADINRLQMTFTIYPTSW